ncbi:PTS sugar transporter subunit IIB [Thermoanaerobacterium thermosaccharolyticum]|uniref:PTS lactose transporter subunit IIB n=1 Tax=Thermoanaerobacterium thermosaccharolyticum TaxID=1517 RepID=A0A231VMP9_THETR|nr:PTS sugar transporter subunit IIB [Thermoanaerobacterium thermosaccharolyticum]MBE0068336.1 PTS sugar transporter subunit IIB [Thermoanaerobacterium thermosaccharolyticum]MBE0228690.1 PTS sugar transporter subunit IIB [Thermoanaerobacterium thermosaccharolyticum]OXT09231.1 PTS lactose transporter subunit IIB [Thermoanaerobacterium thermosaccharolyticum]
MKVVTVCGMGMGTSLMMLMEIQDIAKKHGYKIEGEAVDLSSAKGKKCDFFVASEEIAAQLKHENALVVSIKNLIDKDEIERKVIPVIESLK